MKRFEIQAVVLFGEVGADGVFPGLHRDAQRFAQDAEQGDVDRFGLQLAGDLGQRIGRNQHAAGFERITVDFDLIGRDHQQAIGLAVRDHRAIDPRAEAHVAGHRTAALAHAVDLTFLDVQPGAKSRIGEDVRSLDDALTAEAGDDDIDDLICHCVLHGYSLVQALAQAVLTCRAARSYWRIFGAARMHGRRATITAIWPLSSASRIVCSSASSLASGSMVTT